MEKQQYTETLVVTPAMAAEMLAKNIGNRKILSRVVKMYTEEILKGNWALTHQGIAFDENGHLLDGQHRLLAVIAADRPITVDVKYNVPRDKAFLAIDAGARKMANQLLPDHIRHRSSVASAARYLLVIEGRAGVGSQNNQVTGGIYWSAASTGEIVRLVERWPELEQAASIASTVYTHVHIPKAAHSAILAQAMRTPYDFRIPEWENGLITGVGLDGDSPILQLRNRYIINASRKTKFGKALDYAYIAKAWNAYALGKSMRSLRVNPDSPPQAIAGFYPHGHQPSGQMTIPKPNELPLAHNQQFQQ